MWQLILGVIIFVDGHSFRLFAPNWRRQLREKYGMKFKLALALYILIGMGLIIWGYRVAPVSPVYTPPVWGQHLAMLLLLVATALFGAAHSKSRLKAWLRHPMLASMVLWGGSHLLVRGDLAAIIMFGGLALWALGAMLFINRRDGAWARPSEGLSLAGDIRLALITAVLAAGIIFWHSLNGLIF